MAQLQATVVSGVLNSVRTENVQTGNYTLALTDRDIVVVMNNTSAANVTIPTDATVNFPIGSVVYVARVNSGNVTLVAAGGVTVSRTGLFSANEEIVCRKRSANNWIVIDRPAPANVTGGTIMSGGDFSVHTFSAAGSYSLIVS
jgi:hypothetical protein